MSGLIPQDIVEKGQVEDYFQKVIQEAIANQGLDVSVETTFYLVNLLTLFADSDWSESETEDHEISLAPLTALYADAMESESNGEHFRTMQRLGDLSLFISGVFSDNLNHRIIDVDYYIAMGTSAYSYLSDTVYDSPFGPNHSRIFGELANYFTEFVDVLGEVRERAQLADNHDILRLYELWLRTGSRRTAERLRELGIEPNPNLKLTTYH